MSKIISEYLRLKRKNKDKLYLFKTGNFYIFLGDDAHYVNDYMVLKITKFSNDYDKCGFPISKIDDYKKVFKNINLDVEIIDDYNAYNPIEKLMKMDIDLLNKEEAIDLLKDIKGYYE